MGKFVDRTGLKYGKLTAVERVPNTKPIKWKCICECGNEVIVRGNNLQIRSSTSDINFGRQQREETDALKREYCNQHNIPLIEIRYDEHIKYATLCAVTELYANPVPNRLCREV